MTRLLRFLLFTSATLLVVGLIACLSTDPHGPGTAGFGGVCITIGLSMLVSIPVFNVLSALVTEIREREWPFAAATAAVVALLAYNVLQKIGH